MAKPQRIFVTVDPRDRWVRVTVLAEEYGEPPSSLHEFIKAVGLAQRWRGGILYINERHYQDAIEALPEEKPTTEKNGQTTGEAEKGKKRGDEKGGRGRNAGMDGQKGRGGKPDPSGEVAVPGVPGRRASLRSQLRLETGGL